MRSVYAITIQGWQGKFTDSITSYARTLPHTCQFPNIGLFYDAQVFCKRGHDQKFFPQKAKSKISVSSFIFLLTILTTRQSNRRRY